MASLRVLLDEVMTTTSWDLMSRSLSWTARFGDCGVLCCGVMWYTVASQASAVAGVH